MTLYIHFGIYKAGSSYIQYICANQRDYLAENGIYFPKSVEDDKMMAGLISKGNADGLEKILKDEDQNTLEKLLKKWSYQATQNNCKSVLISAEALVHQLSLKPKIDFLNDVARKRGFTQIKAMGFFRDLADHALSTYKHRAKSGKYPDYEMWVKNKYETPELLQNLYNIVNQTEKKIEWNLRKFQKNSNFLKTALFVEWLHLDIPDFVAIPSVNESVTLSEIKVLNHLNKLYPRVIDYFIEDFKSLHKAQKGDDLELENYIKKLFWKYLITHKKTLSQFNTLLSKNEQLIIDKSISIVTNEPDVRLSNVQLRTTINRVRFFNKYGGKIILLRRRMLNIFKKNFTSYVNLFGKSNL